MKNATKLINNRYQVIRELGEGSFGATLLVEDKQLSSGKH